MSVALQPVRAISLPFRIGAEGGIAVTTDPFKLYCDRIVTILLTKFGERVMVPLFGSDVQASVFEAVDDLTATSLAQEVQQVIQRWEPSIGVVQVTPGQLEEGNGIVLNILFQIPPDDTIHQTQVGFGG